MKAAFYTLGCKVNQYETEYMAELLKKAGFEIVDYTERADYYIINSCTVTATADQKSRQNVRKFKRKNPDSVVILTGCMPQAFPDQAEALKEADIVISNKSDNDILDYINRYNTQHNRIVDINEHKKGDAFEPCTISSFSERIRAFVKIEDGCDRFCSYCIIPKSRGRVRSKDPDELRREVKALGESGIKEIVLVGINLSSYGKGEDFDLVDAVRICAEDENVLRVRLGSLEPDHITDDVISRLFAIDKLCPQFHISLQSGCDRTLKNMNRHYSADEYRNLCNKLRDTFENCTLTTDVMVGFNEETDDDFEESLRFVKDVAFEKVHVFPYSEREGTVASRKGDSVSKKDKESRARIMIDETDKIRAEYMNSLAGSRLNVLFENEIESGVYQGYTKNYVPVRLNSKSDLIGSEIEVTAVSYDQSTDCIIASL